MQELDVQTAQVDQELANQTCNLLRTGEEADQAHREEIELKAEVLSAKPGPFACANVLYRRAHPNVVPQRTAFVTLQF